MTGLTYFFCLRRVLAVLVGCAIATSGVAVASEFPSKPIRLVVGYTPGTGIDVVSRIVADEVSKNLQIPVVVDNRTGAGGTIAGNVVAKATPDGYTLHWGAPGSAVINHYLMKSIPYGFRDLAPVTLVGIIPLVVIVPTQSKIKTLKDLTAAAKANPGKLNYGTPGIGTSNHMATELFMFSAKIRATHVPYKGSAADHDLIAGRLDFVFDAITTATPFISGGKVRPLAVTTATRSPLLPEVATIEEQGYPDYQASNWYVVMAPTGTPGPVIDKLNAEFVKAVRNPKIQKRLESLGVIVTASSANELQKFLDVQYETVGRVVKEAGIKAQ
jgi:tripartite-type tricarboxylate transporter receptor subunit TctC